MFGYVVAVYETTKAIYPEIIEEFFEPDLGERGNQELHTECTGLLTDHE